MMDRTLLMTGETYPLEVRVSFFQPIMTSRIYLPSKDPICTSELIIAWISTASQSRVWSLNDAGIGKPEDETSGIVIPNGSPRSRFHISSSKHGEEPGLSIGDSRFDKPGLSSAGRVSRNSVSGYCWFKCTFFIIL